MENTTPNSARHLKAGGNFSLRLPHVVDSHVLAELNRHLADRDFNAYCVNVIIRSVERDVVTRKDSQKMTGNMASSYADESVAQVIEAVVRKVLKETMKVENEGPHFSEVPEHVDVRSQPEVKETLFTQLPPVSAQDESATTAKNDKEKRRRKREMARDIQMSAVEFGK